MRTVHCRFEDLARLIVNDLARLKKSIQVGILETAIKGGKIIKPRIPVAFGPLLESLHVDAINFANGQVRIVVDAPHAAAVEEGSRPHTPPLAPLIAWVKLRGMQALRKGGNRTKLPGPTSAQHASAVGGEIASMRSYTAKDTAFIGRVSRAAYKRTMNRTGDMYAAMDAETVRAEKARAQRGHTPIDVPEKIARAIQGSIAAHGTKPSHFVRSSMPDIEKALHRRMKDAVKDP